MVKGAWTAIALMFAGAALARVAHGEDYAAEGLKALDANQPAQAEPLFRKAIEADPKDYSAHFNLAFALTQQHKDADAIAELRKTLELKPGLYDADLNLGILLLRNKQPVDAATVLKEAAAAKPKEFRPNFYLGDALLQSGDAAGAAAAYQAAADADGKSAPAQLGLAHALLRQGKLDDAAGHFRAAASLDPKYHDGLLELAAQYEKERRFGDAIAIYRQFPENAAARERLGALQVENKDFSGAIPNLEQAVRASPTTANRLALADAYRMAGDHEKEIAQLQLAEAADPNNFDLHMILGRALRDQRQLGAAAQHFWAATKLHPDDPKAWNELASALIINGNDAEGLAALDHLHALGKELPGDYYLRAITLDKLKMKPQAVAAYQQFLATDNGAAPNQEFLARQRIRIIESELKKR
jgi:Flp pilus assembly protein TadD